MLAKRGRSSRADLAATLGFQRGWEMPRRSEPGEEARFPNNQRGETKATPTRLTTTRKAYSRKHPD
eukprot:4702918-Heterocapsa_arctica.AAC.1